MLHITRILRESILLGCLLLAAIPAARCAADEPATNGSPAPSQRSRTDAAAQDKVNPSQAQPADKTQEKAEPDQKASSATTPETPAPAELPKRTLTPAMTALRDRVRRILAAYASQTMNPRENTVTDLLYACLAFGCSTEVYRDASSGQKVSGITFLCWNYPCAGYEPLLISGKHIAARVGYGLQERPSQFLAVLAQSHVPPNYPIRVGQDVRSVADLAEAEKLSCRSGGDLSLKLIGLSHYAEEPSWKNDLGEEWSLERIITEELAHPVVSAPEAGTSRLLGLSHAVDRCSRRHEPIEGALLRAQQHIHDLEDFALKLQNSDGSWGPSFPTARGASRDPVIQLRATGQVLEWLAFSLPEERLQDARVVRSVEYVSELLGGQRVAWNLRSGGSHEIGAVMHALSALSTYDARWFKPADAEKATVGPAAGQQKTSAVKSTNRKPDLR